MPVLPAPYRSVIDRIDALEHAGVPAGELRRYFGFPVTVVLWTGSDPPSDLPPRAARWWKRKSVQRAADAPGFDASPTSGVFHAGHTACRHLDDELRRVAPDGRATRMTPALTRLSDAELCRCATSVHEWGSRVVCDALDDALAAVAQRRDADEHRRRSDFAAEVGSVASAGVGFRSSATVTCGLTPGFSDWWHRNADEVKSRLDVLLAERPPRTPSPDDLVVLVAPKLFRRCADPEVVGELVLAGSPLRNGAWELLILPAELAARLAARDDGLTLLGPAGTADHGALLRLIAELRPHPLSLRPRDVPRLIAAVATARDAFRGTRT